MKVISAAAVLIGTVSCNTFAATYRYDVLDRLMQVTYQDGTAALYAYDAAGNLLSVRVEPDIDGDRVPNVDDAFPFDPNESVDTDTDGIGNNADQDDDNDGADDVAEAQAGTDPLIPDVLFELRGGLNLIALPIEALPPLDSRGLLDLLGDAVESIARYDSASGRMQVTTASAGPVFALLSGEGYELTMRADEALALRGGVLSAVAVPQPGTNLTGLPPAAANLRAFALLEQLGGPSVIASISRFNRSTGRYETATFNSSGQAIGVDFAVTRGEAYWVWARQ